MKITYDPSVNALYIKFEDHSRSEHSFTYPCDPIEVDGMINLDFNEEKRLTGIEILGASEKIDLQSLLNNTEYKVIVF